MLVSHNDPGMYFDSGTRIGFVWLCFIIKTRVAWWVKAKFPSSLVSIAEIVADLRVVEIVLSKELSLVVPAVWKPPPVGWLKFNIDGATRGVGLGGGIGGILKNEFGVSLLSFSLRVGAGPPVLPEVLAIFYCIWLFVNSEFFGRCKLVVESDCKMAIDWICEPANAPSCLESWVKKIAEDCVSNRFIFHHVIQAKNMEADSLAKLDCGWGLFESVVIPMVLWSGRARDCKGGFTGKLC
ncbi:hypothetical protein V6N12_055180 [Hibiscus sabdariffa]|uniref:RNase H type-1 domain-containing protein n=1 Tax=Hibiscus sabdariffa TaxID=183260 RepID=A0ABR2B282_9ROSI